MPLTFLLFLVNIIPLAYAENPINSWSPFTVTGDAITLPLTTALESAEGESITEPSVENGRELAIRADKGNCITCHHLPGVTEEFQGTIGPALEGVGARLSAAQIRLRIADMKKINPFTIMPAYYKDPATLNRVAPAYKNKTLLSAPEIEDIVSWLSLQKGPIN